jgi:hypothetical protein
LKVTTATISFVDGFAFTYRGASDQGNQIAIYEFVFYILFAAISLWVTLSSLYVASDIWTQTDARVDGASNDGIYGAAVSNL